MDSPAAAQDAEKLRHFLDLVAVRLPLPGGCFCNSAFTRLSICHLQNVELTKLEALQLMNSKRLLAAVLRRPGRLLRSRSLLGGAHSPLAEQVEQLKVGDAGHVPLHDVVRHRDPTRVH